MKSIYLLLVLAGSALFYGCASTPKLTTPAPPGEITEQSQFRPSENQVIGLIRFIGDDGILVINSSIALKAGEAVSFRDSDLNPTGRGQVIGVNKDAFFAIQIVEGNPNKGDEVIY